MHLTGNEIAATSSAVAVLAIVGGYLGVRSANRNSLKLAREERAAREKDELETLKRRLYAEFLDRLNQLAVASIQASDLRDRLRSVDIPNDSVIAAYDAAIRKQIEAQMAARNAIGELELIVDFPMHEMLDQSFKRAARCDSLLRLEVFAETNALRAAMRDDLYGRSIPSDELNEGHHGDEAG